MLKISQTYTAAVCWLQNCKIKFGIGSIPLNIHEARLRLFFGEGLIRKKIPIVISIGHTYLT